MGKRKLTRAKDGLILGVCKGIADWLDIKPIIVRAIFLLAFIFLHQYILFAVLYIVLAVILPPWRADETMNDDDYLRNCKYAWDDLRRNARNHTNRFRKKEKF